jgi:hypothetical protein
LTASANSGLPIYFNVLSGGAAVTQEGIVTLSSTSGVVEIQASQPGNANYEAAAPVLRSFTIDPVLSVDAPALSEDGGIRVWPIPATEFIAIKGGAHSISIVELTDVLGKSILEAAPVDNALSIDVQNWSRGIYFLKITIENNRQVIKRVIFR